MRIDTKMKKLQKYIMILETVLLCTGFSACSKQPDFDAKSYVQSSLDAYYHGDYKDYANLLEISEKDAKKEIEEDFNESIQQQFDDSVASSFGGETGFMILWILELVSYLSVLSWGISFQLVEKPAEIKLIIIPDDFRNFIDGIGCCFK